MRRGKCMTAFTHQSIKQKDGYITKLTCFRCSKKPKASLLILHGMAEHQKRYYTFANDLTEQGYDVFIYDHRGHGSDTKLSDLGFIAPNCGHEIVVDDVITISEYIVKNNRSNKFFLFGHSMGSLIARNVIQSYDNYNGVILCGTANPPRFITRFGIAVAYIIKRIYGPRHVSPYLNNLMFRSKQYTLLANRTAFDWLTRSNPVVGAYIHDPYCGFVCTASFYHDLLKLTYNASLKNRIKKTRLDLPLYIISGEQDPVGGFGKDVKRLIKLLESIGFTNIASKLYPDCRHELLNELNNHEVYSDIRHWLSKH